MEYPVLEVLLVPIKIIKIYTKVQYKFDNNNNMKKKIIMCIQVNNAFRRLYQAYFKKIIIH